MGETLSLFTTSFNRSLAVEARPERLSRDAGAVLLREILERTGIIAWLGVVKLAGGEQAWCRHSYVPSTQAAQVTPVTSRQV